MDLHLKRWILAAAAKAVDSGPKAVPYINFEESVAELRKPAAPKNWMLCALIN